MRLLTGSARPPESTLIEEVQFDCDRRLARNGLLAGRRPTAAAVMVAAVVFDANAMAA